MSATTTTASPMTEAQLRDEICRVSHSLFSRGYVHATAGNISVRLPEASGGGYLITPTDACLGALDPAKLAKLDASGQQISGEIASKTIALHIAIYGASARFDPETACVIHTHSTHCVALTLQPGGAELLPALTPYFVMKVGHVPLIPYHRPGDPLAAECVVEAIARYGEAGTPLRAVMLERLGPNVWHHTPAAAMAVLEELEETARLWALTRQAQPQPAPLTEGQIQTLRDTFGARW
jgi:ribulose-5-phosphate 4-epimerase/fuculose-1-phosphate aldolase